jgi:hypothetical protein
MSTKIHNPSTSGISVSQMCHPPPNIFHILVPRLGIRKRHHRRMKSFRAQNWKRTPHCGVRLFFHHKFASIAAKGAKNCWQARAASFIRSALRLNDNSIRKHFLMRNYLLFAMLLSLVVPTSDELSTYTSQIYTLSASGISHAHYGDNS